MNFPGDECFRIAHVISRSSQIPGVDMNPDGVSIAEFTKRPPGEGFGGGVAQAGARRHSREAAVSQDGKIFANRRIPQGGSHLIGFRHTGPQGAKAGEDKDVSFLHSVFAPGLEGGDGGFLGGEDPGGALVEEDPCLLYTSPSPRD